jgi:hypothetical protein
MTHNLGLIPENTVVILKLVGGFHSVPFSSKKGQKVTSRPPDLVGLPPALVT